MVGRSHVLFIVLGLALVGCSNSDESSDSSGQAALNGAGSENDNAQAPEADGAPKHKPLLVLCRPPQKIGAMGGPGGPAPFVPDANQEGGPQEGGPHPGGPRPLPCVAPKKHLPLLCAPAPFWREVLSTIGGPGGEGPPVGAPPPPMGLGGPGQDGPRAHGPGPGAKPPILCIVAPPRHSKDGPAPHEGGFGFGDGAGPDANEGPDGAFGDHEMPKLEPGQLGGKLPPIFACRPHRGGPHEEMGGPGGGPEQGAPPSAPAFAGGPEGGGPKAHALALACVPLRMMGPPPGEGGDFKAPQ